MRYRKISVQIWNDEKFRSLSDQGKLAFLYILTHPHMTGIGAMRATRAGLIAELGWDAESVTERVPERVTETLSEGFNEPFEKGLLKADWSACLVVAPNFLKHNPPENPNVVRGWVSILDTIPECDLQREYFQYVKGFLKGLGEPFAKPFPEPFPQPFPNGMPKGMPKQEQEQDLNTTTTSINHRSRLFGANRAGSKPAKRPTPTAIAPEPGGDGGGGDAAAGGDGGGGIAPVVDIVARLAAAAGDQAEHDARAAEAVARIASTSSAPAKGGGPPALDSVERIARALRAEPGLVAELVQIRGLEFVAHHAARLLGSSGVRNPMGALVRLCQAPPETAKAATP